VVFESAVLICAGQAWWYLLAVHGVQGVQKVQKVQTVQTVQEVQGVRTAVCPLVRQGSHPPRGRDGVFSGCRYPCGPWFPGGPAAGPPSLRVAGPCSSAGRRSVRGEARFRRRDTSVSGSPPCSANDSESPGSARWSPVSMIPMSTHDEAPLDADHSEQGRYTQVLLESSLLATSPPSPAAPCLKVGLRGAGASQDRREARLRGGRSKSDLLSHGANHVRARFLLGLRQWHEWYRTQGWEEAYHGEGQETVGA